jgi:hypothetical protein
MGLCPSVAPPSSLTVDEVPEGGVYFGCQFVRVKWLLLPP